MNYPYDDTNMAYNSTIHGYVLTVEGVRELLGVDLGTYLDSTGDFNPSTMGARVLKMISTHLYAWIYGRIPNANKDFIEFLLAKYPPCRELIQECLANEVYYALKNGDFWNYADNSLPESKSISETTRFMLENTLPNGICLLSIEPLPFGVPASAYRVDY